MSWVSFRRLCHTLTRFWPTSRCTCRVYGTRNCCYDNQSTESHVTGHTSAEHRTNKSICVCLPPSGPYASIASQQWQLIRRRKCQGATQDLRQRITSGTGPGEQAGVGVGHLSSTEGPGFKSLGVPQKISRPALRCARSLVVDGAAGPWGGLGSKKMNSWTRGWLFIEQWWVRRDLHDCMFLVSRSAAVIDLLDFDH